MSTVDYLVERPWDVDETVSEYRSRMRPKLPTAYSGWQHLLMLLLVTALGTMVPLAAWSCNASARWIELVIVPCTLMYTNVVEYMIHRYGGHDHHIGVRPKALQLVRFYHAVVHHTFFGDGAALHAEDPETDLFFILFPTSVYTCWAMLASVPLALCSYGQIAALLLAGSSGGDMGGEQQKWCVLGLSLSSAVQLFCATVSFSLLQYEVMHCFHHGALPASANAVLARFPPAVAARQRHELHHSGHRDACYNITWPLADALFGTLRATPPGLDTSQSGGATCNR